MTKRKPNTSLYIIGNGFDLHHKLNTSYQSYAFFLQKNYSGIHQYLVDYFGLPYLEADNPEDQWNPLWSDLESALASLDFDALLEDNRDLTPNFADDDFRSGDVFNYQAEMQSIVGLLTYDLRKSFKEFILSVPISENETVDFLDLDRKARYLSFNYTNTLEKLYKINYSNITYIHGFALDEHAELILGHGVEPDKIKPKFIEPPDDLTEEEVKDWYERGEDGYEFSHHEAQKEILTYFPESYKSTSEIIEENEGFFDDLKNIEAINVLGHSVSDVDQLYFKKIIESTGTEVRWIVTYYSTNEKLRISKNLIKLGVRDDQINLVQMNHFKIKQPDLFD